MSSPAKKRKLNSGAKQQSVPAKGLEYFFAKQRQNGSSSNTPSSQDSTAQSSQPSDANGHLTDEELAKKLQAEWDAEVRGSSGQNTPQPQNQSSDAVVADAGSSTPETHTPGESALSPSLPAPQAAKTTNTLSLSSASTTADQMTASIPLDENPLTFEPTQYIPELQKTWAAEGGDASYALLTRCFVLVNGTQSRIKIVDTLVNCIRLLIEGDPASLLPAVWLATNAISPPYISMELGLGGAAISKALKQACGLDQRALKALYDRLGDPGDVAFEAKKKQSFTLRKPKPLTIKGVFQSLVKIATAQGQGSGDVKQRFVDRLLQDARGGEESRYIVRTLCQHVSCN
jgi:DNA ligase-1